MTVILFAAIVVSLGIRQSTADAATLTVGFFLGSAAWWMLLVSTVAALRGRLTPRLLHIVTVVSGLLIAAFGAITLLVAIRG